MLRFAPLTPESARGKARDELDCASCLAAHVAGAKAIGLDDREIVEVVGIVALNLLTGAFNLVAGIEPED